MKYQTFSPLVFFTDAPPQR